MKQSICRYHVNLSVIHGDAFGNLRNIRYDGNATNSTSRNAQPCQAKLKIMSTETTEKPELLICNDFHSETIARLDECYNTHHLWKIGKTDRSDFIASLAGRCKVAATASWDCDPLVYQLQGLKLIAAFGVGVDGIDFARTRATGIRVTNTPDVLNDAVADLAIAMMLATTRRLVSADKFARQGLWQQGPFPFGISLAGKTLGIAGLGRIGEEIAQRALPFKMKIAYHNRHRKESPFPYYDSLLELASASDILIGILPGGDATRNLFDAGIFKALGPDSYFINIGRGSSVVEEDLISALQSGEIAGAALDVYQHEPNIPAGLIEQEKILLLPHIGSATVETRRAMGQLVIDNISAFLNYSPLPTEYRQA